MGSKVFIPVKPASVKGKFAVPFFFEYTPSAHALEPGGSPGIKLVTTHNAKATRPAQKAWAASKALLSVAFSGIPGMYIRPRCVLPPRLVRLLMTAEQKLGRAAALPPPVVVPVGTLTISGPSVGPTRFQMTRSKVNALLSTGNRCVLKHSITTTIKCRYTSNAPAPDTHRKCMTLFVS